MRGKGVSVGIKTGKAAVIKKENISASADKKLSPKAEKERLERALSSFKTENENKWNVNVLPLSSLRQAERYPANQLS